MWCICTGNTDNTLNRRIQSVAEQNNWWTAFVSDKEATIASKGNTSASTLYQEPYLNRTRTVSRELITGIGKT